MLFSYAVLRVVPRVDRAEFVVAGVLLYCQDADVLACRTALSAERVMAVDPKADVEAVTEALGGVALTCDGAGPVGALTLGQRFRWLTAPRSTVLQTGPVHGGLCARPMDELDRLFALAHPGPLIHGGEVTPGSSDVRPGGEQDV